jgi:hypothetical protein
LFGRLDRRHWRRRLRLRGEPDLERINTYGVDDILEPGLAQVTDFEVEPGAHLAVRVLRETDRTRLGYPLQSRCGIDAVAHKVAVALLDDIAQMNADTEFDLAIGRHARVAFDHRVLHLDGATHRIDHGTKFDQSAVTRALDDAPVVDRDRRIDQIAAQRAQTGERAVFVGTGQPAEADHICG